MRERSIIHINVADFAVAVERLVDRRLKGRPVIVVHDTMSRRARKGVIFFNNHVRAQAPENAQRIATLLKERGLIVV